MAMNMFTVLVVGATGSIGRLVVADFKSERVEEKSAAKIRDKYAEQGRAYLEAVRLAWGEAAEFRLLFLRRPDLSV